MHRVFSVDHRHHGKGSLLFAWHPSSQLLASIGSSRIVYVSDKRGKTYDQFILPSASPCIGLEWDPTGQLLAALQQGAGGVVVWHLSSKTSEFVDMQLKEPTFMKWSKTGKQLAIGSAKGDVLLYDWFAKRQFFAAERHKKRISCGDWNADHFAFASDDRQITIANLDGSTYGKVKVKSKPTNVKFGGNDQGRENIVSVSMDRKTILLYNLDDPENALELAFQPKYGQIVSFKWFAGGYVMIAFSLGFLVVISTHLDEIGREQFCWRYHRDSVRDMAYCASRHKVATCTEWCIKIIDMEDWKEQHVEEVDRPAGQLERLEWSPDGLFLCASTRHGTLFVFYAEPTPAEAQRQARNSVTSAVTRPLSTAGLLGLFAVAVCLFLLIVRSALNCSLSSLALTLFEGPML